MRWHASVWTEGTFTGPREQWAREFKWLWTAYLYTRFTAWYLDHFVIPKHYGWQEVWGGPDVYDSTPLPIGIYWGIRDLRRSA